MARGQSLGYLAWLEPFRSRAGMARQSALGGAAQKPKRRARPSGSGYGVWRRPIREQLRAAEADDGSRAFRGIPEMAAAAGTVTARSPASHILPVPPIGSAMSAGEASHP